MRKLFLQLLVSADGYFEGPNHELDWFVHDGEFFAYVKAMLDEIDAILLGRVTYDHFAQHWPNSMQDEAPRMNELQKYVVSETLDEATWSNSTIIDDDVLNAVADLKAQPGNDIAIFGSSILATYLADHGLIDEYRIFVIPVLIGQGRRFLDGLSEKIGLSVRDSRVSSAGVITTYYAPNVEAA